MMKIQLLDKQSFLSLDIDKVNDLIKQLSGKDVNHTQASFVKYLSQPNLYQYAAVVNQKLVGLASLFVIHKIEAKIGLIEGVVVDMKHRRQGIGKALVLTIIDQAKRLSLEHLDLTSNPTRVAANNLYLKLGFVKRQTNVYRLKLING